MSDRLDARQARAAPAEQWHALSGEAVVRRLPAVEEWLKILGAGVLVFCAAELEKLVIRRTGLVARLTSSWKPGLREEAA